MAKLIKRGELGMAEVPTDAGFAEGPASRAPIIDRETFEARSEGQMIKERAKAQAEQIVAQAEEEAKVVLEKAREEAEQIKKDAHDQGYQEGKTAGVSELSEVVATASMRLTRQEEQIVPQLKDLAVMIARKILGKELEFHPEAVVSIVRQALSEKARQRKEIFLRVNPEDLAMIRENKPDLIEVLSRAKEIGLREDPQVQRYGVIIETDAGTIDAQLETQLAVFERVLKDTH